MNEVSKRAGEGAEERIKINNSLLIIIVLLSTNDGARVLAELIKATGAGAPAWVWTNRGGSDLAYFSQIWHNLC